MNRIENLQQIVSEYGQATIEQVKLAEELGRSIISGFPGYLGCDPRLVYGVPPEGDFIPRTNYRDACFSTYYESITFLEPIYFGLCAEIPNLKDSGAVWVRTIIEVQLHGDTVDIYVGDDRTKITLSKYFEGQLDPVFEAIHEDIRREFSIDLTEFKGRPKICFMTE